MYARAYACCGQKITYFLEREYHVRLSVPKIYEILAEKYVIRSKWRKNQKRGAVPKASCARAVTQNGYRGVWAHLRLHRDRYLRLRRKMSCFDQR